MNLKVQDGPPLLTSTDTNIGKSATQHVLAERAAQLDAEQAARGQPSAWRTTYSETRCSGLLNCDIGLYCWYDSTTKRRHKLKFDP